MLSANSINNSLQIKKKYNLLFLFMFSFACFSCENNMKNIPALRKKQVGVEVGRDIESFYSVDAKVKAKLTSPYMLRYLADSPYVEFTKSLHVDFYNDTMRIETQDGRQVRKILPICEQSFFARQCYSKKLHHRRHS